MDNDNAGKIDFVNHIQAQANVIASLSAENTKLRKELESAEIGRSEWMGHANRAWAQLEELRLAFKVLVRGGKED